jgi:hypothetical protein
MDQLIAMEDDIPIPSVRLSDDTLHYFCLLAILYHLSPPPLICMIGGKISSVKGCDDNYA